MNHKVLTIGLLIFGLLITALITRNGYLAVLALPFLAYLAEGLRQAPSAERIQFSAVRSLNVTRSDGMSVVEMSVTVQNQGAEVQRLCLSDPFQPPMEISDGCLCQWVALRAGEEAELKYTFQARRGSYSWKTIRAVVSDPFGLIETELDLPASAEIQLQPELKKYRPIPIRLRSTLHSPGSIPARLGGNGTDFWGVREYQPGDSLRWLDWRLTARHPRKFFTKEFEQEEIADIGLILDARQKSDLRIGEDSLFEHSLQATASLAELFLRQGHRVSMLVFGKGMVNVFPGYGKVQLNRILRCLAGAKTGADGSLSGLEFLPIRMFSSHSLIVILSPLVSSDWPFFPRLRAYGYQGLLISPDPVDFAFRKLPQDPVNQLAIRATRLERRLELRNIARLRIPVIDWRVSQPLFPLVRSALSHNRGRRNW